MPNVVDVESIHAQVKRRMADMLAAVKKSLPLSRRDCRCRDSEDNSEINET